MNKCLSLPEGYLRRPAAVIRVRGEDSFAFLQSQGTADLRDGGGASSLYGLWLDHKGLIHGDARIWQDGDGEWWLISEATAATALIERLDRHIIADDVELVDATDDWQLLTVSHWPAELAPLESTGPVGRLADGTWALGASKTLPGGGLDFLVSEDGAERIGLRPVEGAEVEGARIRSGRPWIGKDLQPGRWNPFEAGLMEAVSLQKGCFLGQEVVARAHRLGRRSARWVSLISSSPGPVGEAPFSLMQEAVQVGECTSLACGGDGAYNGIGWLKARIPDGEWRSDDGRIWHVRSLGQA